MLGCTGNGRGGPDFGELSRVVARTLGYKKEDKI
jgi:hypothetical protein